MHRLAVPVALALIAAACGSDPMLASEFDTTSTTITTTTAPPPTSTIMQITTTTTIDPGPDVSDLLRIAHDELYEFDSVRYAALTDTNIESVGPSRQSVVGRWNRDGTSTLRLAVDFDGRIAEEVIAAMNVDPAEVETVLDGIGGGTFYRFPDDGLVWFSAGTAAEWRGVARESFGEPDVEGAADALTYLDPLFESIIEVETDPSVDAAGNTVYGLVLDADIVVPVMAVGSAAKALTDAGYDGASGATTTGSVTLDADGALVGAFVDQTPWWRAGWDTTGVGSVEDDATVHWTMAVRADEAQVPVAAPCDDPVSEVDPELGIDVSVCPG